MASRDTMPRRFVFENAKAMFAQYGVDVSSALLTQSELRSEVLAATNTNTYTFQVLDNKTNGSPVGIFNTEKRLALQDAILVSEIALYNCLPSSNTDDTFPLYTWPNPAAFTVTGQAASLYSMYNGFLRYNVNNTDIDPRWGCNRCLYVPRTQLNTTNGTYDSVDFDVHPFSAVEPEWVMSGAMNFKITLNMANGFTAIAANGFQRIGVIFRGVLAQNVTSVK